MLARNWARTAVRLCRPMRWSITARRLCLLVLPIAVPAWIVAMVCCLVFACASELGGGVRILWSAPAKSRRYAYRAYRYGRV
jgi:hypothetical protein